MGKRDHANGQVTDRPQKKSKTEKHAKPPKSDRQDPKSKTSLNENAPVVPVDAASQPEIDQFLESNSIKITDPSSETPAPRPILSFKQLPSCDNDLYAPLSSFSSPTPIQSVTWPFLLAGRDVIGIAETGSGKTLAFALPCFKKLLDAKSSKKKSYKPAAVIIAPTRELAMQTYGQLSSLAKSVHVDVACIYGGVKKEEQREILKTAAVVVATPGRLKDLQNDGSVDLGKVKYLVLDEADRMLDKGFEQDIKDIIHHMPVSRRQTVMFTATWPPNVRDLAASFMTSPVTMTVGGDPSADPRANSRIKQTVEVVNPRDKETRLLQVLKQSQNGSAAPEKVLVFCLYKKEAVRVEARIKSKGFRVVGIHGDMGQHERFKSLESFKSGTATILVATDVAARGLDIPSVRLVLNYTFPLTVEDYVHRIGR